MDVRVGMWRKLSTKELILWPVVLEKTLESPLDCKEIQPVHSKGDQSWCSLEGLMAEAETPVLWPPHAKSWLTFLKIMWIYISNSLDNFKYSNSLISINPFNRANINYIYYTVIEQGLQSSLFPCVTLTLFSGCLSVLWYITDTWPIIGTRAKSFNKYQ